ncbi:class II aldolase/adducin family protein [Futiania mangrovi]|uniref:Class II aldolase/adducin family protein n=1 Tax=Futiania mangrovi TaxID=2959716 RepID=A0A9J6PLI0_9PROT|nr:class II aldolase/adducin family protein [Futiania mangrovii]MCP1337495.1 class II aldolase/adducin family protein [Futiania mangrovii]
MSAEGAARASVLAATLAMSRSGLTPGKSGNVSARVPGGMVITPTGVPYEGLTEAQLSFVGEDGATREGEPLPSSEWHFHMAVYAAKPDVGAVVHTHSRFATALACTETGQRDGIPPFHYMVAVAGGTDIACAPYATFGTEELAGHVVAALKGRNACLLAHHGVIACGATPEKALALAHEVETLAAQYVTALGVGGVRLLDRDEMARVIGKFRTYGQQPKA